MYIERCKHGLGRGWSKPTIAIWQGGSFLLYTDYEAGIRSGYLQAQGDHAGLFKYKKALSEGKSKKEAREISQRKGG